MDASWSLDSFPQLLHTNKKRNIAVYRCVPSKCMAVSSDNPTICKQMLLCTICAALHPATKLSLQSEEVASMTDTLLFV